VYSQQDEEAVIAKFFGDRVGRFLDIGAWDGVTFSNTRALWEKGWSGVVVDVSPFSVAKLITLYGGTDRVAIVSGLVVGHGEGMARFYDSRGDGLSTSIKPQMEKWKRLGTSYAQVYAPVITLPCLFSNFPGPYNLISIDTEGSSLNLFRAIDFDKIKTELVVVEHDLFPGEVKEAGRKKGFWTLHENANNVILAKS
jgi:FkbM family methyltransferase